MPADRAISLAQKATVAPPSSNVTTVDVMARGGRCHFFHSSVCIEEHAAASCSTFGGLFLEAKEKALLECGLCTFGLRHPVRPSALGSVSKAA
jgi:hypothetical protein